MPLMPLAQAIAACRQILEVDGEMLGAVSFGPDRHHRYSAALIILALKHLETATKLLDDPNGKNWPSAFALSRVAADAALRAVYLGFGSNVPSFEKRFAHFLAGKPSPFGTVKGMLAELRHAIETDSNFAPLSGKPKMGHGAMLDHVEEAWSTLNDFTHGGEMQARLLLHQLRTHEPPREEIRTTVIFETARIVSECVCLVLVQRSAPERAGIVAIKFMDAFPPEFLTDDVDEAGTR